MFSQLWRIVALHSSPTRASRLASNLVPTITHTLDVKDSLKPHDAKSFTIDWDVEMAEILKMESNNPLEYDQYFEGASPILPPSFNLAAYVNKSELLQQMVKLGVSIHHWERMKDIDTWILTKDFCKDVQPIIRFLVDQGVEPNTLGTILTKNPFILNTSIEELEIRNDYLLQKNFNKEMISKIYTRNPFWLVFR